MGLTIEATNHEQRAGELTQKDRLVEELAALHAADTDPEDPETRELLEDIAFEKAKNRAAKDVRLGRLRVDPGQIIFRQWSAAEMKAVNDAGKAAPGRPEMTTAQADLAARIATQKIMQACMKSPSPEVYAQWCVLYPLLEAEYITALNDHNAAYRRARSAK